MNGSFFDLDFFLRTHNNILNLNTHTNRNRLVFTLILASILSIADAQDVHYAQTGNSPFNLNPAFTGSFEGDQRATLNIRRQRGKVSHPYLQLSSSYDFRIKNNSAEYTPWSGGLIFNYERAGNTTSRLSELGITGSYRKSLSTRGASHFSVGASVGGMQRAYRTGEIWINNAFIPREDGSLLIPSDETLGDSPELMEKISVGTNFHLTADSSRTAVDFGAALFHPTEPEKSFSEGVEARLQARYSLYFIGTFETGEHFDLVVSANGQFQYPHEESVFGLGGQYRFPQKNAEDMAIQLGLYYRPGDAPIPYGGTQLGAWRVQLSYDPTSSKSREMNERIGGPELSIIYIFRQVPKVDFCKTCPTFM